MGLKRHVSWEWVYNQLITISKELPKDIEYVTGIARGGLIPAVMLSHMKGIEFLELDMVYLLKPAERNTILLIDDIADSGVTLGREIYSGFITATLCMRYTSTHKPNFYGEFIEDDNWIIFPWERNDSDEIQDYLKNDKV